MIEVDEEAALAIVRALRAQADTLAALLQPTPASPEKRGEEGSGGVFNPLTDDPPVEPLKDTRQPGYRVPAQIDWCGFLLWGGLFVLNQKEGRFATEGECRAIAQKAGYKGNGAWTGTKGWTEGTERDSRGGRKITKRGRKWLVHYMEQLGVRLPDDLMKELDV